MTGSDNGKTATVVFSTPFTDWQSLFGPMFPAHIAKKVGFNNGFQHRSQVAGLRWAVRDQSYAQASPGRNAQPAVLGNAGNLDKLVFRFIPDDHPGSARPLERRGPTC